MPNEEFAKISAFIPCESEKEEIHQPRLSARSGDYDN
jgi:hypothetical protein